MKKFLCLLVVALSASGQVREIAGVSITVAELDREIRFFKDVLAFEEVGPAKTMRSAELHLAPSASPSFNRFSPAAQFR